MAISRKNARSVVGASTQSDECTQSGWHCIKWHYTVWWIDWRGVSQNAWA